MDTNIVIRASFLRSNYLKVRCYFIDRIGETHGVKDHF